MRVCILFTFLLLSSCSSFLKEDFRFPASLPESDCRKIMNKFIDVNDPESEISLHSIQNFRSALSEHYQYVAESVKDLELNPDLPINTEAKIILDPQEGLLAKVLMIRNAKKTIDLTYFIFQNDDTNKTILNELRLAIKRGVKVRLMVDSLGSLSKAPFYSDIKALTALSGRPIVDSMGKPTGEFASMEAVLFNPVFNIRAHVQNWIKKITNIIAREDNQKPMAEFVFNRRSHDKILLIDSFSPNNSMAIIGGRNIADHYYAINDGEKHLVMDAEVLIKGVSKINELGKVENVIEEHYNKLYFYLANKNFSNFLFKTNSKVVRAELRSMREGAARVIGEAGVLTNRLNEMQLAQYLNSGFENSLVSVVSEIENLTRKKVFLASKDQQVVTNVNSLIAKLNDHIKNANKQVDIVTPYFWMPDEEIDYLINWLEKDSSRKVRIITNSIVTNNHLSSQAISDQVFENKILKKIKDTPIEKQFELYSYGKLDHEDLGGTEKYGLLHAKVFIIDGKNIMISTSNLDPISRHLNSEFGISAEMLTEDSRNAKNMNMYIENLVSRSTLWGSIESEEIRNHSAMKVTLILEKFMTKIIYALNLEPIL